MARYRCDQCGERYNEDNLVDCADCGEKICYRCGEWLATDTLPEEIQTEIRDTVLRQERKIDPTWPEDEIEIPKRSYVCHRCINAQRISDAGAL